MAKYPRFPKVTPKVTKCADQAGFGLLACAIKKASELSTLQRLFGRPCYDLLQPVAVDHRSENPRVGGSIPPLGTIVSNELGPFRSISQGCLV